MKLKIGSVLPSVSREYIVRETCFKKPVDVCSKTQKAARRARFRAAIFSTAV